LADLGRKKDAVRDLRAIPGKEAEADEAYALLGELEQDAGAGTAVLGRVDILITKGDAKKAIAELASSRVPAAERLERFERITESKPDLDAAQQGRAEALLELKRLPDGIDAHFRRFRCRDVDPAAVANDLEALAGEALEGGDIENACAILERLPNAVGDGADRALKVVGERQLPPLLILRSKLLLQQERTDAAVKTLADLVRNDETSRAQAAQALQSIVASGQARPEADFALAEAFDAMGQMPQALAALSAIYVDDITAKENVLKVAEKLIRRADDADARLFIARICLDMRDAGAVTEHCLAARRLRPEARRDVVGLLQSALDLDAFSASTHFALAEAHLAGDEADDAVRHLRAAVEVDRARSGAAIAALAEAAPRSKHAALLWLAAGTTHAEFERDYESAVHAYSHGLEANPTTELKVPLLLGRGDAHAALKQDEAAFNDFDEASDHDLLERRYYEFLRSRHRKKVLVAARAAQERASVDFAAAAEACGRFIRLGMASDAVAVSQTALANDPANVAARYLVGVSLHAAGRYDAAVRALEAARSGAGSDTEIGRAARMLLAESYLDQGDRDKARACLVEIEAVNAAYPGLKTRRGSLAPPADDPHAPPPLFVRPEFPRPTE
ncbi:MAG: tetratricopeptide repeat protein, partial [Planctomycetota bacterium]|nr:tetratricopeptide repeat protein [Planctomycetota bacterium]